MANGTIMLDEKDWKEVSPEQRDRMIYNTLVSIDGRLKKLENKKWINSSCALIGGAIGWMVKERT